MKITAGVAHKELGSVYPTVKDYSIQSLNASTLRDSPLVPQ